MTGGRGTAPVVALPALALPGTASHISRALSATLNSKNMDVPR